MKSLYIWEWVGSIFFTLDVLQMLISIGNFINIFPQNQKMYLIQGFFNQYLVVCVVQVILVEQLMKYIEKEKLNYNMHLNDRRMSYEMFTMLGGLNNNDDQTILNISDNGILSLLTGFNNTKINQKPKKDDLCRTVMNENNDNQSIISVKHSLKMKDIQNFDPKSSIKNKNQGLPYVKRITHKQILGKN